MSVVTIKPRAWEQGDAPRSVTLTPRGNLGREWTVTTADGTELGTVTRYTGSLDRQIGRLRAPGKTRILWGYRDVGSTITMWDQYSRADCIRALLNRRTRWTP